MGRFIVALAALLTAFAAPAAAREIIRNVSIETQYSRSSVSRATEEGALVEIYGAPEDLIFDIAESLRLPGWFQRREFVPIYFDPDDDQVDRLVVVFGPAPNFDRICQGRPRRPPIDPEDWRPETVTAAFCDGFEVESRALMVSPDLGDPGSPAFRRAFQRLMAKTLPRRNPNRDHGRCRSRLRPC